MKPSIPLRAAARDALGARTHEQLGAASDALARAMQLIGLDRWQRYLADAERRVVLASSDGLPRPYQVAQLERPAVQSDASGAGRSDQVAADRLTRAAQAAYDHYPRDCSRAVWEVMKQIVNPGEPYRTANDLMAAIARPASGWRQVTSMREASDLANAGKIVIGGLADPGGNGHVLIVMPGPMRQSGGFQHNGRTMPTRGMFPPAMSGSLSGWPGAMSRGDKTVRDAWDNKSWERVTFWTRE